MSTPEAPVTPTPDVARAEELLAQLNNVLRLVVQSYPDDPSVQSARVAGVELRALVRDLAREREEWQRAAHTAGAYREQERTRAEAAEASLSRVRGALAELVADLDALISDSNGVAGLHRNGDLATWDWLTESEWLSSLAVARSLASSAPGDASLLCDVCAKPTDPATAYVECPSCFRPPPEPAPAEPARDDGGAARCDGRARGLGLFDPAPCDLPWGHPGPHWTRLGSERPGSAPTPGSSSSAPTTNSSNDGE